MEVSEENQSIERNEIDEWQSTKITLKERFNFLFNNERLADCHFIVGTDQTHRIPTHKLVLSVSSSVFERMFFGALTSSDEIILPDVELPPFLAFLKFIYSDEVKIDQETVMSILYLAKKYNIPPLKEHCVKYLEDNIDCDHAILLLTQARFFDESQLAALCLEYIDTNILRILEVDDFIQMNLETLSAIIERDTLQINESKLYQALLRWSEAECSRQKLPLTAENQRFVLGPAFMLIRFPLMSIEEFGIGPVQSGLMTDCEVRRMVLYYTVRPKPEIEFLDVPRLCGQLVGREQSVNRFAEEPDGIWWPNEGDRTDSIIFMVDRRIFVVGFGLYGHYDGAARYDVEIQLYDSASNKLHVSNKTSFESDGSRNTFHVRFKRSVQIIPHINYMASIILKGPHTFSGRQGKTKVTVNDIADGSSINFKFSSYALGYTNILQGQIPEIIFYT